MPRQNNSGATAVSHKTKWHRIFWLFFFIVITLGIGTGLALFSVHTYIKRQQTSLPELNVIEKIRHARPSKVFAADGTLLTEFRQTQQQPISLQQVSPYVLQALVSTEDQRFYEHEGIDLRRTAAALLYTLTGRGQGGSTITQQLARNLFPEEIGRERSIQRKVREMLTALKIEQTYGKHQILELYLNTVPFLYNAYGIEMAARTYFNKPAAGLSVPESATLVGMLKGTQYYNPVKNPERALKRRNVVLHQMMQQGWLTQQQFEQFRAQPLGARLHRLPPPAAGPAPHFAAYVRKWLTDWADRNGLDLYADGLVVQTTLDMRLQTAAENAVERQTLALQRIADVEWGSSQLNTMMSAESYARRHKQIVPFSHLWKSRPELIETFIRESADYKKYASGGAGPRMAFLQMKTDREFMRRLLADKTRLEAGFVAMDPGSGEVRAWVGSRDFNVDQFDHVAQAVRQPGSTFKPFVYGAALEQGISPRHTYRGGRVEIVLADGSSWKPSDMDIASRPMSLREGLVYSKNTITAQVMEEVGIDQVVELAQAMGVRQSRLDPVVSIALGTSPVTLLEMVTSYATIARAGEYRAPVAVKRILDRNGKVLAEFGGQPGQRVLSEEASTELIDMLRGAVRQGTGQLVRQQFGISADVAGKTGTTQNNTDGWFILMHPELVAGAWIGFNDQRITMRSSYWGQGGHNAILVVGDFFRNALRERQIDIAAKFPQPERELMTAGSTSYGGDGNADEEETDEESAGTQANDSAQDGAIPSQAELSSGHGIIVRRKGGRILIGDAQGIRNLENDRTPPVSGGVEVSAPVSLP